MVCGDSTMAVRPAFLPAGGGSIPTSPLQRLRKSDWWVAGCDMDIAYRLVAAEHYAKGASNTATYLHGLYPRNWMWFAQCVGIAWWIPPTRTAAEALTSKDRWQGVLSLSRLAVEPDVKPEAVYTLHGRMTARKAGGRTRTHREMLAMGCLCEGRFSKARFVLRQGS